MTVKEFIKQLEAQAAEKGVLDDNISTLGAGMSTNSQFYSIKTESMTALDAIQIVYLRT